MARIYKPVFGVACGDCEEQVPHGRVRVLEADALAKGRLYLKGKRGDILCVNCQQLRENEIRRAAMIAKPHQTIKIIG